MGGGVGFGGGGFGLTGVCVSLGDSRGDRLGLLSRGLSLTL